MLLAFTLPTNAASPGMPTLVKSGSSTVSKPTSALKQTPEPKSAPIDTAAVRRYYMDGDFEPAIDLLETAMRYKTGFSREDTIFIFKHLGVMYVANYETREKGKRYMRRLLEVEPTARILDMYASDMIYMIFKNIKDEFDASMQGRLRPYSVAGNGQGTPRRDQQEASGSAKKKSSSAYLWLGATAALITAAGAATYYYFSDAPEIVSVDHQPD